MSLTRDSSGALHCGGVLLQQVIDEVGTPTYVYDLDAMADRARELDAAFEAAPHLVAYAVKANTAGAVVRALAEAGCGADVVSGAELVVALACGIEPDRIVYSGVAKADDELDRAIACGPRGIAAIQVESLEEIARVGVRAKVAGRKARIGIRINPSIDLADATHAHIQTGHDEAKFGVPLEDVPRAVALAEGAPNLELVGMAVHAGSQLKHIAPYLGAARVLFDQVRALRDGGVLRALTYVDSGGGFGVDYGEGAAVDPVEFVRAARAELRLHGLGDLALYIEPGRSLVAAAGVLVARVIQAKVASAARWLMIDAGMNDLVRPALYQARHRIVPLDSESVKGEAVAWHVVGPVCESSDDFGEHLLPRYPPRAVAILDAGAYGYTMASRYNGRQMPVEVFLRGGKIVGKTERATPESWAAERVRAGTELEDESERKTVLDL